MNCRLSPYQLSRIISLVDLAISANVKNINSHNDYLRSLSEDDLLHLDDYDYNFSDCLEFDNSILRELKLCLQRGAK